MGMFVQAITKRFWFFFFVFIVLLAVTLYFLLQRNPAKEMPVLNFTDCVVRGFSIQETYPRRCFTPQGVIFVEQNIASSTTDIGIRVFVPQVMSEAYSPLVVSGEVEGGWFFEGSFPIQLLDDKERVIGFTLARPRGEWMTPDPVSFDAVIQFQEPTTRRGVIVFHNDNPSGIPQHDKEFRVPIVFKNTEDAIRGATTTVKVFFGHESLSGEPDFDCKEVLPVEREILKIPEVGWKALEELLRGPTPSERRAGYYTSINPGVLLKKLTIQNGVAQAEFDKQLEYLVGGSCRVAAMRAEITETLKQFPSVHEVVISVDGGIEDVLQP